MARHKDDFRSDAKEPLSLNELFALLDDTGEDGRPSRKDAIACYLSTGDGWREAVKLLGGTFSGEAGLRGRKSD